MIQKLCCQVLRASSLSHAKQVLGDGSDRDGHLCCPEAVPVTEPAQVHCDTGSMLLLLSPATAKMDSYLVDLIKKMYPFLLDFDYFG